MKLATRPTSHLRVQEYLRIDPTIFSFDSLETHYGIKSVFHPTKPLVILNYSQINSPKTNPIVRDCRGLVLNTETHEVVARAFPRFFNWGEVEAEAKDFDFDHCHAESKEDGSLCLIYWFDGEWIANTRGTFGDGKINSHPFTWSDGFAQALGVRDLQDLDRYLDRSICYVGEFCSKWNKVVREYDRPLMFLLSAFCGHTECDVEFVDAITPACFKRPMRYPFGSIEEVQSWLREKSESDPTFEGVVLRDRHNNRWKVKSPTYLALHRLKGDGDNMYLPKNLLPFIMTGETSELLTYFPEVEPTLRDVEEKVRVAYETMRITWADAHAIESQKEFAQAIIPNTLFHGILFEARKRKVDPYEVWKDSTDLILKKLFE